MRKKELIACGGAILLQVRHRRLIRTRIRGEQAGKWNGSQIFKQTRKKVDLELAVERETARVMRPRVSAVSQS